MSSGSEELADAAAEAARDHDAVVLAHHGCSALGDSVPMALRRALNLEEAAMMTYRLLLAGNTTSDFPEEWRGRIITV
jgi:L-fuculose-phosphate aldolase